LAIQTHADDDLDGNHHDDADDDPDGSQFLHFLRVARPEQNGKIEWGIESEAGPAATAAHHLSQNSNPASKTQENAQTLH
jgi:hypothetical protein